MQRASSLLLLASVAAIGFAAGCADIVGIEDVVIVPKEAGAPTGTNTGTPSSSDTGTGTPSGSVPGVELCDGAPGPGQHAEPCGYVCGCGAGLYCADYASGHGMCCRMGNPGDSCSIPDFALCDCLSGTCVDGACR